MEWIVVGQNKIRAVQNWPKPDNLKQLRGFLGLSGYYRRFVYGFAKIVNPLIALLCKNAFEQNQEAEQSF